MYLQKLMRLIMVNNLLAILLLAALPVLNLRAQVQEMYLKGIAFSDHGEFIQAREYMEKALSYDDDNANYLLKLAEINYHSGNSSAAMANLNRLEQVAPGKGSYLLAYIHASSGDAIEAIKALESHLQSEYKLPSYIILLDEEFSMIENSPEWRKLWSRTWYSEEEEFLQEVRYLNNNKEYLQALELLDTRLKGRDDWDALYAVRGDVLLNMNQFQGAVQSYSRAIEISSVQADYYYGRAEAYLAQDKPEKSISDFEKAMRMEPENLDLLLDIARIYYITENYPKAANYLNRSIDIYPGNLESLYLLGQVYFDSKKYLDALDKFNTCLKLSAVDPRFYAARGKTYLETKTYRYALNDFSMALDLDPNDYEVWYWKGLVRWQMNDREGSLSDWRHAARLGSFEAARKLEENGITK